MIVFGVWLCVRSALSRAADALHVLALVLLVPLVVFSLVTNLVLGLLIWPLLKLVERRQDKD